MADRFEDHPARLCRFAVDLGWCTIQEAADVSENAVEAKHDEGVAERRLRFDEEDLAVEERKEAPSSDDEDVEAPPTPSPAPPLPPRSRDHDAETARGRGG